jgi:hypothetical protein
MTVIGVNHWALWLLDSSMKNSSERHQMKSTLEHICFSGELSSTQSVRLLRHFTGKACSLSWSQSKLQVTTREGVNKQYRRREGVWHSWKNTLENKPKWTNNPKGPPGLETRDRRQVC